MTMHEPMTVITDAILAMASVVFGLLLLRRGSRTWATMFFFTAAGTAFGGLFHALGPGMFATIAAWKAAAWSVGLASFFLLVAAVPRQWAATFAVALFILYATWMISHNSFLWVIIDYGLTLLIVALVHAAAWVRERNRASGWIVGSVAVSLIAALVQRSPLAIGPFNHNDLFHAVQLAGLWLLYRGANLMTPATDRSTRRLT